MIRINLIPYREEMQKIQTRRQLVAAVGSLVLIIAVVALFQIFLAMSVSTLEKDVRASRADLDRLKAITGDLDKYEQDKALVEKKLQVIEDLELNRDEGFRLLTELSRTVPEGQLWITRFSKRGSNLRLEGMARNNAAVALFMERLEESPMIGTVDLVMSRRITYASTELKNFQLSGTVQAGEAWQ